MLEYLINIDKALFLFFNREIANPFFDSFLFVITDGRFWVIPGILFALLYIRIEKKRALVGLGLAVLTVALSDPICCRVIKPIFERQRPCHPYVLLEGGRFLLGFKSSFSFPSAHAMNMFAQATLFSLLYPAKSVWFFIFAGTIGFSRIYVGVHYPFDVIAGAVFGMCIGAGVYFEYRRFAEGIISAKCGISFNKKSEKLKSE